MRYDLEYDVKGRVVLETREGEGTHRYFYDAADRLIRSIGPDGGETEFAYDVVGRKREVISTREGLVEGVRYFYDGVNPLGTVVGNGIGRLTGLEATNYRKAVSYTKRGQPESELMEIRGLQFVVNYSYDRRANLTGVTYPNGKAVDYDSQNAQTTYDGQIIVNLNPA